MKNLFYLSITLLLVSCSQQTERQFEDKSEKTEINPTLSYDSLLADELGADDYGMRKYVVAYLKAGPNRDQDSTEAMALQRAHLDNITKMANEGKLVLAGPFLDDHEVKGIYVFAVETLEEARVLTHSDPAVQAGRLEMELRPWYGSAALMKINELHHKISKEKI